MGVVCIRSGIESVDLSSSVVVPHGETITVPVLPSWIDPMSSGPIAPLMTVSVKSSGIEKLRIARFTPPRLRMSSLNVLLSGSSGRLSAPPCATLIFSKSIWI